MADVLFANQQCKFTIDEEMKVVDPSIDIEIA